MQTILLDELFAANQADCFFLVGADVGAYRPPFRKCQFLFDDHQVILTYDESPEGRKYWEDYLRENMPEHLKRFNALCHTSYPSFSAFSPFAVPDGVAKEALEVMKRNEYFYQTLKDQVAGYLTLSVYASGKHISDASYPLAQNGTIVPGFSISSVAPEVGRKLQEEKDSPMAAFINKSVTFSLFALHVINCRNIETVKLPREERTARRGCRKSDRQYILSIRPMKKQAEGRTGEGESLSMPLTVRRGYFADYSKGRGLFGRHKGIFWFNETVLGKRKNGVIQKDYTVKPPASGSR